MDAIVVGCGVSGLSCGIRLQKAGFNVTILARDLPPHTTSNVAAAIWYPYRAYPLDRVLGWSRSSLDIFYGLCDQLQAGVRPITLLQPFDSPAPDPWWRDVVRRFERAAPDQLPPGMVDGYVFEVPLIETPIYMSYLLDRFTALGGQVRQTVVDDLRALCRQHRLVVNCSGVWARDLAADAEVFPIRGQVVRSAGSPLAANLFYEPEGLPPVYRFARADGHILGGTTDEGVWDTAPNTSTTTDIIARLRRLLPDLGDVDVIESVAGLRPGRREVRLERETVDGATLIHNYGHGGAGFTLSWGCAGEVVELACHTS